MSLTFLYSLLIIMYVFFNQHLTSSMALNKENDEGDVLNVTNLNHASQNQTSQPRTFMKWVLGKDNMYHECPTNESLVDEEDIMTFIDYIYDRQSYKKQIMSNYTDQAQQVADEHSKHVDKLEKLVENPADHLNYTLEELAALRNITMDPMMAKVQDEIGSKPQLESQYKMRQMEFHLSLRTLKEYRHICSHNCRRKLKYHVEKRIKYGQSFCVNIHELYDNIDSKLSVVAENVKTLAHSLINKIDKKLEKKENALRRKIEKGFLGRTGKTLINVLKLENEHEKFSHDLVEIGNGSVTIEELGVEMDNMSLELRHEIEKYGEYCVVCDLEVLAQEPTQIPMRGDFIVSELVRVKYEHVWNAVHNHVRSFYYGLFAQLKRIKKVKSIKQHYRLTREEEAELRRDAEMVLDHLEAIGPLPHSRRVVELVKKCKELLQKLEVKFVKAYML